MGNCLGRCLAGKNSLRRGSTDDQDQELMQEDNSEDNFIYKIMKFKRKKRPQFLEKFWDTQDLSYSRLNQSNAKRSDIQLQCLDAQTLMIAAKELQSTKYVTFTNEPGMGTSSRASSSLDLEWEHEYTNNMKQTQSWIMLPEGKTVNERNGEDATDSDRQSNISISNIKKSRTISSEVLVAPAQDQGPSFGRTTSRTSWSHISTPESLEWDIDEDQQKQLHVEDDQLDHETLELLHEIEMLKNKVLHETGDGLTIDFPEDEES